MLTYSKNTQGDILEKVGDIVLNQSFWDCECKENYIHKKSNSLECSVCGMDEENSPDSRENEVQEQVYKTIVVDS